MINSTVAANCCVMRCSECSHMSEYAVLPVLLLLALHPPQRITQGFPSIVTAVIIITTIVVRIGVRGVIVIGSCIFGHAQVDATKQQES